MTGEAVRQQLLQLQREGWVHATTDRTSVRRTGRPASSYRLSDAGDHLFPKAYDALALAVIDAVAEELGQDAAIRVLERVSNDRVEAAMPAMEGLTLPERINALRNWYADDDPYMDAGADRLIERNCPFYNTAMRRPALCSVSVNALTRLLGVRVRRVEKFQNGDGRCVFVADANDPIDAGEWQFALET